MQILIGWVIKLGLLLQAAISIIMKAGTLHQTSRTLNLKGKKTQKVAFLLFFFLQKREWFLWVCLRPSPEHCVVVSSRGDQQDGIRAVGSAIRPAIEFCIGQCEGGGQRQ